MILSRNNDYGSNISLIKGLMIFMGFFVKERLGVVRN